MKDELEDSRLDAVKKQRRAQVAKATFMVVVVISLGGLLTLGAITLDRVQNQVQQQQTILGQLQDLAHSQTTSTEELKKDTANQLSKQTQILICIAQFFATTDRSNKVIADLNTCSLETKTVSQYIEFGSPAVPQMAQSDSTSSAQQAPAKTETAAVEPTPQTPVPPSTQPARSAPSSLKVLLNAVSDIVGL